MSTLIEKAELARIHWESIPKGTIEKYNAWDVWSDACKRRDSWISRLTNARLKVCEAAIFFKANVSCPPDFENPEKYLIKFVYTLELIESENT